MTASTAAHSSPRLLVIGGGNMGSAIVFGGLRAGVLAAKHILIVEPDSAKRESFAAKDIQTTTQTSDGLSWARAAETQILLAIKPQMLPQFASACGDFFTHPRVIISILAGTPIAKLRTLLGNDHRIIRCMPNIAAAIGLSTTALCQTSSVTESDAVFARRLFAAIGPTVVTVAEELMDPFTAVAGSGPAYLFYLAESMQRAAMDMGFDQEAATAITRGTLLGAASMLSQSADNAATLRQKVTSRGGTTEAAIKSFDDHRISQLIQSGIAAAAARAKELSQ